MVRSVGDNLRARQDSPDVVVAILEGVLRAPADDVLVVLEVAAAAQEEVDVPLLAVELAALLVDLDVGLEDDHATPDAVLAEARLVVAVAPVSSGRVVDEVESVGLQDAMPRPATDVQLDEGLHDPPSLLFSSSAASSL